MRGVLLPIRPRRQTINHAPETTTSRALHPPETKGQLLRVAAAALRLHPAALASDLGAAARGKHVLLGAVRRVIDHKPT